MVLKDFGFLPTAPPLSGTSLCPKISSVMAQSTRRSLCFHLGLLALLSQETIRFLYCFCLAFRLSTSSHCACQTCLSKNLIGASCFCCEAMEHPHAWLMNGTRRHKRPMLLPWRPSLGHSNSLQHPTTDAPQVTRSTKKAYLKKHSLVSFFLKIERVRE